MRWSSPSSWGGESPPTGNTTDIVYIPEGKTAMLDMDVNIRFWVIEGNVIWDQEKNIHMEAEAIVVNGGSLLIGSKDQPYERDGRITLHGHWHSLKLPLCGTKTLFETRGTVEMHGKPVPVTWTELETTAHPGSTEIQLRRPVDWKPGDMIVVAASDKVVADCRLDRRDDCQVEERYVKAVDGAIVTLDRPLVYRHVAEELDPLLPTEHCQEHPELCLKTQVRAEVGLLTRNIQVRGSNFEDGSGMAGSEGFGAHLMHAEQAQYTYVEFHWMGQAFQMGRYPLHFHLTGLNPTAQVVGCSLHKTFNRGITVHGTHQATLKDNVLYNHLSHGYFIEDGNEHDNVFENNLGMMTHRSFAMLNSDQTPATFWIRNPSNYFRNNHAAGSAAFGFWFDTLSEAMHTLQRQFENNTAHSNGDTGVWVDLVDSRQDCRAPDTWTVSVPFRDSDAITAAVHENPPACGAAPRANIPFLSTTTWGNAEQGVTSFESGHLHFINHRSVSDGVGILVWGVQSDNWPDETNGWYGPTILNSVYHSVSQLTEVGFRTSCSIRLPWDDTLHVSGTQFIGQVAMGHFCPCHQGCNAEEGGYQHRTSKLGWHEGAGTAASHRVRWPWPMAAFFFDLDGTLTEDSQDCQAYGCYLHSGFEGQAAGMLSNQVEQAGDRGGVSLAQGVAAAPSRSGGYGDCSQPLVGLMSSKKLADERITASSYWRNRGDHGYGQMWRSRLDNQETTWCANTNDVNQYLQWDFEVLQVVRGVQTKGRANHHLHWVKTYRISYSPDGKTWKQLPEEFEGNWDQNTMHENGFMPIRAMAIRLHPVTWSHHICMRADLVGCFDTHNMTFTCLNRAYLNEDDEDCQDIERRYSGDLALMSSDFCQRHGAVAKHTALSANMACCVCGGGERRWAPQVEVDTTPAKPPPSPQDPKKILPGGTAYLPPEACHMVDGTGGIVCSRSVRLQTVTIKNAGVWHMQRPIRVQSDFGFATTIYSVCYRQYEFSVFQDMRHMLVPPMTASSLADWDSMRAEVTMRQGDRYVIQIETIQNPDGWTVKMPGVEKSYTCDESPVRYGPDFYSSATSREALAQGLSNHSGATLNISMEYDLYKIAHLPLLETAGESDSAGNWGYLAANASYVVSKWHPGVFSLLLTDKGLITGANHYGPWNGLRRDPREKMVTRPVSSGRDAATMDFSHIHTTFAWSRWSTSEDMEEQSEDVEEQTLPLAASSRLEYLVSHCGFSAAAFGLLSPEVAAAVEAHEAVGKGSIQTGSVRRFKWSEWPRDLGGKPSLLPAHLGQGLGNVTIEADWEVTIDEDVDFVNTLNISGVLKFEDKPGCCKLVARYIMVGPFFGRLEAGTEEHPFVQGHAHIVLRGQPMTPELQRFRPHIAGSAKWMKSKFIAVQGTLSLWGEKRSKIWSRIATSVAAGATSMQLEEGDFRVGDTVVIDRGLETRRISSVQPLDEGMIEISFTQPLENSYRGADHVHLGREQTQGLMAASVGLVDGHNIVVEGEDTPGVPMCSVNETQVCPYQNGLQGGVNLHEFAKEMQHYLATTGSPNHPNCRPCRAVSEMHYTGYIIAMAHFNRDSDKCPKDHGRIQVSGVAFNHASSMHLYHDYAGGNYPHDVPKNFQRAWTRRPFTWWSDPIWAELKVSQPTTPSHKIVKSSFNNTFSGNAFALATSGVRVFPTLPVVGNVIFRGGVGLNGAARRQWSSLKFNVDTMLPANDNAFTVTQGVGSPNDEYNSPQNLEKFANAALERFVLQDNLLVRAHLTALSPMVVTGNVITGSVRLQGGPLANPAPFANNVVNAPDDPACIFMMSSGDHGVSDNVVFGCRVGIGFRQSGGLAEGAVRRMRILDCDIGIQYFARGPDGMRHDSTPTKFVVSDTVLYAKSNRGGIGMTNPKVHSHMLGHPFPFPDWWNEGPQFSPLGHSYVSIDFHSEISRTTFAGYDKAAGGVAFAMGEAAPGDTSDADFHPLILSGLTFDGVAGESRIRASASTRGAGLGVRQCLQIDCDGLRNMLLVDTDGSLLGQPGTVVPRPQKFFDKLSYTDALGASTMEDLIPFPQRFDRFGQAIPFPAGVDHGAGGGLEYACLNQSVTVAGVPGCDVFFMDAGDWVPQPNLALGPGHRIVAIREDGGMIRLDPLHHGWALARGWVKRVDCNSSSQDPALTEQPESQHARRYGRVKVGQFGTHPNTSRLDATAGPVYTVPGIWREGCTFVSDWSAYRCPNAKHRPLVIEVMDFNHMDRRWAPVTVEVNDKWAPQGGAMNVLTGPAMMLPGKRLQTFHALGHAGLRHNIYFSADPPKHLRLHMLNAGSDEGMVVCIYYGVPNSVVAYVDGKRRAPLAGATPAWDNLVLHKLTPDMPHGTYYYDRIGVETGRPGYLYAVVRGGQMVDFKISHKIVLTSKVEVTSDWGGWNDAQSDNFFKSGIDGLVRNIALLVGVPPSRVSILGEGTAQKGAFWNEDTTSKDFAEWMWAQNQSLDQSPMEQWLTAPAARGLVNTAVAQASNSMLLQRQLAAAGSAHPPSSRSLLQLSRESIGQRSWQQALSLLSAEERAAAVSKHSQSQIETETEMQYMHVLTAQKTQAELAAKRDSFLESVRSTRRLPVRIEVDGRDLPPVTAKCKSTDMMDCKAREEDSINKDEQEIEKQALWLDPEDQAGSKQVDVTKISVDDVPRMNSPLGWSCLPEQFNDGETCDCDCGIWDPDCDGGLRRVFAVRSTGTDTLKLIDHEHAQTVLNILDGDGNANGVLDGFEVTRLRSLGVSALFGVAERIIRAQEAGNNEGGGDTRQKRLGNFAQMGATEAPHSCAALLQAEGLLSQSLASYTPMCVKDTHFLTVVDQPMGRCALQPKMVVGSQCFVPGNGMPVSVLPGSENETAVKRPSTASVCGLASRIFRSGQGVGGLLSVGIAVSTAGLTLPGGEFLPGTGAAALDMKQVGLQSLSSSLGAGGFSFYALIRFDRFKWEMPVFAFGDAFYGDYITVDCRHRGGSYSGLGFTTASAGHALTLEVKDMLRLHEEAPVLFTVSRGGQMTMWLRGIRVGDHAGHTTAGPFSEMYIAGGQTGARLPSGRNNRRRRNAGFEGSVRDIRIWDREVSWSEAVSGVPQHQVAQADEDEEGEAEVDAPCIASQKNTWDFVCDEVLPDELASEFGYGSGGSANAKAAFETREDMGEVTACGSDVVAKGYIFHGKFGDGLTGEYFRLRTGCSGPVSLFGKLPHTVQVDPAVNFTGGFSAAYNEYVVRWSGKLLISTPGSYEFGIESKDGSWLAIGGRLLIDNRGCHNTPQTRSGSVHLDKGPHDIAVLYSNNGPAGQGSPGLCRLTYSGPDTKSQVTLVPQEKLGFDPMRLSKIQRHANSSADEEPQDDVVPGEFVYDDSSQLAVMPAGACDVKCRRGLRKISAVPMTFFCSAASEVSFVARVDGEAEVAMAWMDDEPLRTWHLKRPEGESFLQLDDSAEQLDRQAVSVGGSATSGEEQQAVLSAMGIVSKEGNDFDIVRSGPSPVFKVLPGEHTLYLQGRVGDNQGFALQRIHFDKGAEHCTFFLEGRDKSYNDCR